MSDRYTDGLVGRGSSPVEAEQRGNGGLVRTGCRPGRAWSAGPGDESAGPDVTRGLMAGLPAGLVVAAHLAAWSGGQHPGSVTAAQAAAEQVAQIQCGGQRFSRTWFLLIPP